MPKRPRTTGSVDSVGSTGARWTLNRFTKLPSFSTHTVTSSHSCPSATSNAAATHQQPPRKSRYYEHSPSEGAPHILTSPAPTHHHTSTRAYSQPDDRSSSPLHSRIYTSEKAAPGSPRSPSLLARQLVTGFQSFFSGRAHRRMGTSSSSSRSSPIQKTTPEPLRLVDPAADELVSSLGFGRKLTCEKMEAGQSPRLSHHRQTWAGAMEAEQESFSTVVADGPEALNSRPSSVVMSEAGSESGNSMQMLTPIEADLRPTSEVMSAVPCDALHGDRRAVTLEDFEVLQTLGTGTFGRVLLVRRRGQDEDSRESYFAMKVLRKSQIVRLKQVEHINSEREIMAKTDHPFVVKLHGTFQDSLNCYMMMEFVMGGEVFSHLRRAKRFSVDMTRFYIATLVLAIAHLHSKRIIYRDLKPENLLIDERGYIKITDFGFSKELTSTDRTWTLCGTPEYLSPEVIQSQGQSFASDYWSLGILMFEMLCGHPPFFDSTPFGTYEKILKAEVQFPRHVDDTSRSLIHGLLTVDVSKRLGNLCGGATDVMNHAWFAGVDWNMLLNRQLRAPIVPLRRHASDCSNFERYDEYSLSNMPGLDVGMKADEPSRRVDPWQSLFTAF